MATMAFGLPSGALDNAPFTRQSLLSPLFRVLPFAQQCKGYPLRRPWPPESNTSRRNAGNFGRYGHSGQDCRGHLGCLIFIAAHCRRRKPPSAIGQSSPEVQERIRDLDIRRSENHSISPKTPCTLSPIHGLTMGTLGFFLGFGMCTTTQIGMMNAEALPIPHLTQVYTSASPTNVHSGMAQALAALQHGPTSLLHADELTDDLNAGKDLTADEKSRERTPRGIIPLDEMPASRGFFQDLEVHSVSHMPLENLVSAVAAGPGSTGTPYTNFEESMKLGLLDGRIRACPTAFNPNCVSTSSLNRSYGEPWEIPNVPAKPGAVTADRKIESAILATQKGAVIKESSETSDGHYILAEVDGVFGRDTLEFLVKESDGFVFYRSMAGKVVYIYPFTTPITDFDAQPKRIASLQEELGWAKLAEACDYGVCSIYEDAEDEDTIRIEPRIFPIVLSSDKPVHETILRV